MMRLNRLDLTRYGHFTEKSLPFAPKATDGTDLHIVYGPNEAGKSTLFSAWLDLLFGIPTRSSYAFLHAGPSMEIGAELEQGGATMQLRRLKKTANSLQDAHGGVLSEGVLQAALGGLERSSYRTMFSLDEATLEEGGDQILASQGDLGQMLFSASAGLAGLGGSLDQARKQAEAFYQDKRKRSGGLYEAKKRLEALKAERKAQEVSAPEIKALTQSLAAAEAELARCRTAEATLEGEVQRLAALAAAGPLRARKAQVLQRLGQLGDLPIPAAEARPRLQQLEGEVQRLGVGVQGHQTRLAQLREQLAQLSPDPAILASADAIAEAEGLRAAHDSSLADLPRREDEAAQVYAQIGQYLAGLGLAKEADPAPFVLNVPHLQRLRALLQRRSGAQAAVRAAEAEAVAAAEKLAKARARLGDLGAEETEAGLSALVARLRLQNPADHHARATADCDEARLRRDQAFAKLSPWRGDDGALEALVVPSASQLEGWRQALLTAQQEGRDALRDLELARADLARKGGVVTPTAQGFSLQDAAAARARREAAWALHRQRLDAPSAAEFEQAMREDDRLSDLLGEAQAEARRQHMIALERAETQTRLAQAEAAGLRAEAAQTAILAQIASALAGMGLPDWDLAQLSHWLDLREAALLAAQGLAQAKARVARSLAALQEAAGLLAAAMNQDAQPFEALMAAASARLEAAERRQEGRHLLAELHAEAEARATAKEAALSAFARWQADWAEAVNGTLLASQAADGETLGAVVDLLERLGQAQREHATLTDRIVKMRANRDRFVAAKAAVLAAAGAPAATLWAQIIDRLRRAEIGLRDDQRLKAEIEAEEKAALEARQRLEAATSAMTALGQSLGWHEGLPPLPHYLEQCYEAAQLREDLAALERDLSLAADPAEGETPEEIAARLGPLRQDLAQARAAKDSALAAKIEAEGRLKEVGSDDVLARIATERTALLEELAEGARRHLAARFGIMTFDAALRRYRDQHSSTMLRRASDVFARLTGGSYTALVAQPNEQSEVLVARAANGATKLASDMSKGTRFQLYLALRIAGYHEMAQTRPAVPFIADDIMESFDDSRAEAAFGVLGQMSQVGQVIYLTHHHHLCDLAKRACPSANIIDLTLA